MVQKAVADDGAEILSLQKLAYQSEAKIYDDFAIPPLTQTLKEIKKDFETQVFLKAVVGEKIVGSVRAFIKDGTCHVGRLIVHPDFQNLGIGTRLMNKIEELFKEAQRFEIFTGHKSQRNLYLYEKLGYRRFKIVKVNEKVTIVYLEKFQRQENPNG